MGVRGREFGGTDFIQDKTSGLLLRLKALPRLEAIASRSTLMAALAEWVLEVLPLLRTIPDPTLDHLDLPERKYLRGSGPLTTLKRIAEPVTLRQLLLEVGRQQLVHRHPLCTYIHCRGSPESIPSRSNRSERIDTHTTLTPPQTTRVAASCPALLPP